MAFETHVWWWWDLFVTTACIAQCWVLLMWWETLLAIVRINIFHWSNQMHHCQYCLVMSGGVDALPWLQIQLVENKSLSSFGVEGIIHFKGYKYCKKWKANFSVEFVWNGGDNIFQRLQILQKLKNLFSVEFVWSGGVDTFNGYKFN